MYLLHYLYLLPCLNNIYNQNMVNLRDRDNLRRKDKRPVPKVSFVRRFDCSQTKFLFCHKFGFTCCTIASILIFFGCLSFVVVVVVFHSSKTCIQLLPFLCGFVFVAHHNKSHVHFVNCIYIQL